MNLLLFLCSLITMNMEVEFCNRIRQRRWNFTLGQQILGKAHSYLGDFYYEGGDLKKAKFHYETAAMAGQKGARYIIGAMEGSSGNKERAVKHWTIAASAGHYVAMHKLRLLFEHGGVSRESIDSILAAYNNSCVEMKSEARDAYIQWYIDHADDE